MIKKKDLKKKYEAYTQIDSLKESQSLERIFSFVIPEYAKDILELETKKAQFVEIFRKMTEFVETGSGVISYF